MLTSKQTFVTHDPVQYCHMPYLPFPPNWPMVTAKDKLADWFEAYASIMEVNVWVSTKLESVEFDDHMETWTVKLLRGDGTTRIFHPHHIILATGQAGEAKVPNFPGQEIFKGTIYHTSQHQDASLSGDVTGKKVVVVGSGNSGHDICQNYYENGAEVTMLQRGGTYVITAKKGLFMLHTGVYEDYGPPTEDADIYGQSMPIPVQFALNVHSTERIAAAEKQELDGLEKAGFKLDFGHDGSGIYRKYITRGGGYYIDVGCSQLVIDGKIHVKQSAKGIKGFEANQLVLADGSKLDADIVVLATGYDNTRTTARKVMGNKIADRLQDVWDINEEGEVNAVRTKSRPRLRIIADLGRCGDTVVNPIFGTWAAVWRCVVFTRGY
jgi:cation diffusion facilitator CzcD-associated flavoprotein CzcO